MTMPKTLPIRLKRAEFERNVYFEVVPPGTTIEDVMSGDFWVHVRKTIRVNDVIEAVAADGSFDADLRVVSINLASGAMAFRVLRNVTGKPSAVVKPQGAERFKVQHVRFGQYAILELKTGAKVADGLDKEAAVAEKARLEAERQAA